MINDNSGYVFKKITWKNMIYLDWCGCFRSGPWVVKKFTHNLPILDCRWSFSHTVSHEIPKNMICHHHQIPINPPWNHHCWWLHPHFSHWNTLWSWQNECTLW
jgi:hypothetical protein